VSSFYKIGKEDVVSLSQAGTILHKENELSSGDNIVSAAWEA
jgi:hypothetical protein